jgi:hypothetical protein
MPKANPIKLFTAIIYEFLKYAEVLVLGKPFQPILLFVGKVKAYPKEAPFRCFTLG